jgi:hypothetical protein
MRTGGVNMGTAGTQCDWPFYRFDCLAFGRARLNRL